MRDTSGPSSASARWCPPATRGSAKSATRTGCSGLPSSADSDAHAMDAPSATRLATALAEEGISALAQRVRGEFAEMPGLRLTAPQAARLFGVTAVVARAVLDELRRASVLT